MIVLRIAATILDERDGETIEMMESGRGSRAGDVTGLRVATLNAFGLREDWARRREVMAAGLAELGADLVAMQEVVVRPDYDQIRDVLGPGYELAHHSEREHDGQGISIASRRPLQAVHEVDLHLGPRANGFACSALIAEVRAPEPVGRLVFVNHLPDWQLTHEAERERQTVAVADFLRGVGKRPLRHHRRPVGVHRDRPARPVTSRRAGPAAS